MTADLYHGKRKNLEQALNPIKSGWHILIGSGAAEPQYLVEGLAAKAPRLEDTEVLHILTLGTAPYTQPQFEGHLRHNALFIGPNVRDAVRKGDADYTPCFLHEIPRLLRSGRLPLDAALIEVSPPNSKGQHSLGVSVDILKAAVEAADYVVAQVNPRMPWTCGDSLIETKGIDAFVPHEEPLPELQPTEPKAVPLWIGRYVAQLVEDGSTLQAGIGSLPDTILTTLAGKKDLGIHSEMISDGVLELFKSGAITGKRKTLRPGKIVCSFCLGTSRLYETLDRNPVFEFHPSDYVNDPLIIAQNDKMIAINSALQIDLTGQVASDSIGHRFYSGVGGQADFIRGAAHSKGGKSIIVMPSTALGGNVSRITAALSEGSGVVTTRADVDFVVTEYGIASLKGKTIRERAVALIQIAHPDHREELLAAAKFMGYLDSGHILPTQAGPYRIDWEATERFGKHEVLFRPVKPSDERRLKELFYSQSWETTYRRFGIPLKRLSERQFQELVAIDYRNSMAIAGFVREKGRERMIAVGRYYAGKGERIAEAAFTVHDDYQRLGIGTFLLNYLAWIAKEQGVEGLRAEVMGVHPQMRKVLTRCFNKISEQDIAEDGVSLTVFLEDWKGSGNPALAGKKSKRGRS